MDPQNGTPNLQYLPLWEAEPYLRREMLAAQGTPGALLQLRSRMNRAPKGAGAMHTRAQTPVLQAKIEAPKENISTKILCCDSEAQCKGDFRNHGL